MKNVGNYLYNHRHITRKRHCVLQLIGDAEEIRIRGQSVSTGFSPRIPGFVPTNVCVMYGEQSGRRTGSYLGSPSPLRFAPLIH